MLLLCVFGVDFGGLIYFFVFLVLVIEYQVGFGFVSCLELMCLLLVDDVFFDFGGVILVIVEIVEGVVMGIDVFE